MGPCKFDDLSKKAADVLNEDHHTGGYQFKAKQKTNWDSSVVTITSDMFGKDTPSVATTSKLSLKWPKPFGLDGLSVDKLEMDKSGKFKFEASVDNKMHNVPDLKLELKSDLKNHEKATIGCVYNLQKDGLLKFETKPLNVADFNFEATYNINSEITVGAKCGMKTIASPQVGASFCRGPLFASLGMKDLSALTAHGFYKLSDDVKFAATCAYAGKVSGAGAGIHYGIAKGTSIKVKAAQDSTACLTVKHELSKGVNVLAGGKFSAKSGFDSFGLQFSIE